VPELPDAFAPPKKFEPELAGGCCACEFLFASVEAFLFPKPKRLPPPGVLARGLAGVVLDAAGAKRDGADEVVVAAGLAPNREGVDCWLPPDAGCFGCPPNKLFPGGGPAGVVELREKVLFGAGVAVVVSFQLVHDANL
jgi:hypothetical protein